MARAFIATGVTVLALAGVPPRHAGGVIDLDVPGSLEAIQRSDPNHFARIERILAEVPRRPPSQQAVATWMHAEFQARNVRYVDLVMTSLPPKKRLEFSLDDKSYVKVVTLTGWGAKPTPAKAAPAQGESAREPAGR